MPLSPETYFHILEAEQLSSRKKNFIDKAMEWVRHEMTISLLAALIEPFTKTAIVDSLIENIAKNWQHGGDVIKNRRRYQEEGKDITTDMIEFIPRDSNETIPIGMCEVKKDSTTTTYFVALHHPNRGSMIRMDLTKTTSNYLSFAFFCNTQKGGINLTHTTSDKPEPTAKELKKSVRYITSYKKIDLLQDFSGLLKVLGLLKKKE